MLPPFIIEQIRKREEEARQNQQPHLELPLPMIPPPKGRPRTVEQDERDRGVVLIDL